MGLILTKVKNRLNKWRDPANFYNFILHFFNIFPLSMAGFTSYLLPILKETPAGCLWEVSGQFLPGHHCLATRYMTFAKLNSALDLLKITNLYIEVDISRCLLTSTSILMSMLETRTNQKHPGKMGSIIVTKTPLN